MNFQFKSICRSFKDQFQLSGVCFQGRNQNSDILVITKLRTKFSRLPENAEEEAPFKNLKIHLKSRELQFN